MEFYQILLVLTLVITLFLGTLAFVYYSNRPLVNDVYRYSLHDRRIQHPADPQFIVQWSASNSNGW